MHIGLDDTDSTRMGCTTHVAALLVEKLSELNVRFLDYPNLIRLNPNVPWKTRGNGALALRTEYDQRIENRIKEEAIELVKEHADLTSKGTDPGIVFLKKEKIPKAIKKFAEKTLTSITTLNEARKLVEKYEGEALGFNSCRGIIGSLAAVGTTLDGDYTYELIAYRVPGNYGTRRRVDEASIFRMDESTAPYTFNNVDNEKKRVIITPRGPDPILFGIRGETAEIVKKAFEIIKPLEPVDRWLVFRSNQGTDAHLKPISSLGQLEQFSSVVAKGSVSRNPRTIPLRHVIFSIKDQTTEVDCAAYEPTGNLRKTARELVIGDSVEVYGAVRKTPSSNPSTINLEKINILALATNTRPQNPACPECGKRLKSMGRGKGFRCERCGKRFRNAVKLAVAFERKLETGLQVTSTRSQRHLTKPLRRYGLEKVTARENYLIENWHFP
jgi:tRNA(Ile2)-agmatinylcytidine synthase